MSCVDITPEMARLLSALRSWPVDPELLEEIQAMPEWDQAGAWGWIMRTGALTGTAHGMPARSRKGSSTTDDELMLSTHPHGSDHAITYARSTYGPGAWA